MTLWYVYIVRCAKGALYTGIATDVQRRVAQHNAGTGARSVKALGRPVVLVHVEGPIGKSDALKREYQIKQYSRAEKLRLISH